MAKYIILTVICIILVLFSYLDLYLVTRKLKKHMNLEKEKACLYRDLIKINNTYHEFLLENKFKRFPMIKEYLEATSMMIRDTGIDLDLDWLLIEGAKNEMSKTGESSEFKKFMDELERCPKVVKKLVNKNIQIFARLIKIKRPRLYRMILFRANISLLNHFVKFIGNILSNNIKIKQFQILRAISGILSFNNEVDNFRCHS